MPGGSWRLSKAVAAMAVVVAAPLAAAAPALRLPAGKSAKAPTPSLCAHISSSAVSSAVGYQVVLNMAAGFKGLYSCLYKIEGDPLDVQREVNIILQQGVKVSSRSKEEALLDVIFSTKARFSPEPSLGKLALFFNAPAGAMDMNGIIVIDASTEYIVQLYTRLALPRLVELVKLDVAGGKDVIGRAK